LARIKHLYDPENRFALNHNIPPVRLNRPAGRLHHPLT
jgi:berberine-like enzyme